MLIHLTSYIIFEYIEVRMGNDRMTTLTQKMICIASVSCLLYCGAWLRMTCSWSALFFWIAASSSGPCWNFSIYAEILFDDLLESSVIASELTEIESLLKIPVVMFLMTVTLVMEFRSISIMSSVRLVGFGESRSGGGGNSS